MAENNLEPRVAALEKDVAEIRAQLQSVPRLHRIDEAAESLLFSALAETGGTEPQHEARQESSKSFFGFIGNSFQPSCASYDTARHV